MIVDVDKELHKTEEAMKTSADALLKAGFTQDQVENLDKFVAASIARIQYGIMKMGREVKSGAKS